MQSTQLRDRKRSPLALNILIIVILVLTVVIVWRVVATHVGSTDEYVVLVHDGDGATTELPLGDDETYTFTTSKGTNIVVVEDGGVRVDEADCPNQDCVNQGTVNEVGRQIICLPHELWVEIVESDAVTTSGTAGEDSGEEQIDVYGS